MKQKILSILLLVFLVTTPVVAQDNAYTLHLNGIPYSTTSPIIQKDDNLYITLDDLSQLLMSPVTYSDYKYKFTTNNQKVELLSGSSYYTTNSQKKSLSVPTSVINNLFYIPIELFAELGYPYTINTDKQLLSLTIGAPYSRNSDDPLNHRFKLTKSNLENIPGHISQLGSHLEFTKAIQTAIQDKFYISFLDNGAFQDVYKVFGDKFNYSPYNNIFLTFRELDTSVYPNVIKSTITLPVSVKMTPYSFKITIENKNFEYEKLWSTFYPLHSLTDIDLNKSADATLMRAFYTYYRDRYDLRDDTYFSPYMTLTSDRTNTMSHGAYTLSHNNEQSNYMIKVYRVHPSGSMHYIIDLESIKH